MTSDEDFAIEVAMDRLAACLEQVLTHERLRNIRVEEPLIAALLLAASMERLRGEVASLHEDIRSLSGVISNQPPQTPAA